MRRENTETAPNPSVPDHGLVALRFIGAYAPSSGQKELL